MPISRRDLIRTSVADRAVVSVLRTPATPTAARTVRMVMGSGDLRVFDRIPYDGYDHEPLRRGDLRHAVLARLRVHVTAADGREVARFRGQIFSSLRMATPGLVGRRATNLKLFEQNGRMSMHSKRARRWPAGCRTYGGTSSASSCWVKRSGRSRDGKI